MNFYDIGLLYQHDADKDQIFSTMQELGLNTTEIRNNDSTLLHLAARYADPVTIKKLLDAGLDVNSTNDYGENALFSLAKPNERAHFFPSDDKKACANLLFDAGASTMTRSTGCDHTIFTRAGETGQWELIEVAAARGLNLTRTNTQRENVLHFALHAAHGDDEPYNDYGREMKERYFKVVKTLADSGFDMQGKDKYGRSPLNYAKECGDKRLYALVEGTYSDDMD